jgi:hypothetical protein
LLDDPARLNANGRNSPCGDEKGHPSVSEELGMKPKVISLFPLQRFVEAGFPLPDQLEFHSESALEEGAIISACQKWIS